MNNSTLVLSERTREDVDKKLASGKVDKKDLLPTCQMLYFSPESLSNNNRLLCLDDHLLSTLEEGKPLYIRGEDEEDAVLCTETSTYELLMANTSNSMLIIKNLQFFQSDKSNLENDSTDKVEVFHMLNEYLEPVLSKPSLSKIRGLLKKSLYKGPEFEYEIELNNLYTFEELLEKSQTSRLELEKVLDSLPVSIINNKYRMLELQFHFRVLSLMLKIVEENSWLLDEVDYEETIDSLTEIVPRDVLTSLFDKYTLPSKIIDAVQLYKYKEREVCRFFAQVLLMHAGKFNLNEFLQAWQESVPEGMFPSEEMLNGISIIDRKSVPSYIKIFLEEDLPDDIEDRFKVLFDVKNKWTVDEITPYIRTLTTNRMDVAAILANYARGSTHNNVRYYSSKHSENI